MGNRLATSPNMGTSPILPNFTMKQSTKSPMFLIKSKFRSLPPAEPSSGQVQLDLRHRRHISQLFRERRGNKVNWRSTTRIRQTVLLSTSTQPMEITTRNMTLSAKDLVDAVTGGIRAVQENLMGIRAITMYLSFYLVLQRKAKSSASQMFDRGVASSS